MSGTVLAVCTDGTHRFSKAPRDAIELVAGLGAVGDAHAGATVQHRSRVARDPSQPNLRQVHLVHAELFDEVAGQGFALTPGAIGENVLTRGVALLDLPTGTRLRLGDAAELEVTGLRNPCKQLDGFQSGLTAAMLGRDADGNLVRKAGVMAVVLTGGTVRPGDPIAVTLPDGPHRPLAPV
ncbi:MAG: MOSC domain-containing protein [Rhodobacterales bacterium]|nr:MOSC domain-containing protein [Rhodobacterales bacterium]